MAKAAVQKQYLIKLYRKNTDPSDKFGLGIYAKGDWFGFDGSDAGIFQDTNITPAASDHTNDAQRRRPWDYERLELYSDGSTLTFAIPTLVLSSDEDVVRIESDLTHKNHLLLRCHMLLLNGEHDTTTGLKMDLYRAAKDGGRPGELETFLFAGQLGDTPWASNTLALSKLNKSWFDQRHPQENLKGKLAGPLLTKVFGDQKFTDQPKLNIELTGTPVGIPTLSLVFRPHGNCEPFPLPVNGRSAGFTLPVSTIEPGQSVPAVCSYRLSQRASDKWLEHKPLDNGATEEWLIKLETTGFEELWNQARRQYDLALRTVRPVNRITLLPHIEGHPNSDAPQLGEESFNLSAEFLVRWKSGNPPLSVKIGDLIIDDFYVKPLANLKATLRFSLGDREGLTKEAVSQSPQALYYKATLSPMPLDLQRRNTQRGRSFAFRASLEQRVDATGNNVQDDAPGIQVRIGSLDLNFGGALPSDLPGDIPQPQFQMLDLSANWSRVPRLVGSLMLPVLDVRPGGQDGLPASEFVPEGFDSASSDFDLCIDRRFTGSAPVVIPISDPNVPATGPFLLQVQESNPDLFSETVSLRLRRTVKSGGADKKNDASSSKPRVIVIDSDPFLVAEVKYTPLNVSANSDVVALWNTGNIEGQAWQLQTQAQPFSLILPPQGIGEEMPKACELGAKDGGGQNDQSCKDQVLSDDLEALDFRFSPAAVQELQPSYTPQNFAEAPWNLRRILGYPGQRDAGAGVVKLHYELLYGLSCSIDAPLLRLAEILSLIGRIAGRIPKYTPPTTQKNPALPLDEQIKRFKKKRWSWSLYAELYSKRVALLEPRASGSNFGNTVGATGASQSPEVFTISQGVSCTFRGNADLYYSVSPQEIATVDNDSFPIAKSSALKGGVSWPFESPRLFHATVRNPKSSSALVSGLALSPLGGTGTAKTGYDKGLSTIASITEIGRSSKVSVSRLGRIGVFHNLARYVIEYERNTSVTKQFAGKQTPFKYRPVLRKVREYVEILEPIAALSNSQQTYPGGGCVKSIEFKQRVIPVSGTWSSNVGDTGWKIPLWYEPDSRPPDSKAYKYTLPLVVLNLAGADGADVECAISSVDKLFFYTDTDPKADSDPHNWPVVSGVDFLPVPPPAPNPPFPSSNAHEIPAFDSASPFGLASFTHQLDAGHGRANLVNGRSAQAIGANLASVTLQRAPEAISNVQKQLQDLHDKVRNDLFKAVRGGEGNITDLTQQVCNAATQAAKPLIDQAKALTGAVQAQETALLQKYANQAIQEIDVVADEMKAQLTSAEKIVGLAVLDAKTHIRTVVDAEINAFIQRLNGLPVNANVLAQFAQRIVTTIGDLQKKLATSKAEFVTALTGISVVASHDAAALQTSVDQLRTKLSDPIDRINSALTQFRTQVQASAETWVPGVGAVCHVWENRLYQVIGTCQTVLTQADILLAYANSGADDKINAALAALNDPNTGAIHLAQQTMDSLVFPDPNNAAEMKFYSDIQTYAKKATQIPDFIKQMQANVDLVLQKWIDDATAPITTATVALTDINPIVDSLAKQLRDFINVQLTAIQSAIVPDSQKIGDLLNSSVQNVDKEVCDAATKLGAAVENQLEAYRRVLEDAAGRLAESIAHALPPLDIPLPSGASLPALLNRAFGEVPSIPNLGFSLPNAAYFFGQIKPGQLAPTVNLTPLLTKVKDLVPNLSPLSTLVPSFALSDRALPVPHLPNFDLSSVFPDFAGLKLTNLFPALKMPDGSSDAVKITHGIDNASRTAWVQADIDLKTDTAMIFSVGPMALRIVTPRFTSQVRAQANVSGQVSKQATGLIRGDWELLIGGSPMITFASTALTFDKDGKLHVDVSPDRVQLSAALSFIQDVIARYTSPDGGFGIYPSATGIETRLALPIPDTSLGTTGITNLTFNFLFGLSWAGDFKLYAGFGLASPNRPFNISVFILGGGGHLVATADFTPGKTLTCAVDMALDASAALSIALGPISGSVHVNLGMRFIFNSGKGDLSLGIFLLIGGEVSILGIISASILLRLDATYENGTFTCRGLFSISIKICWCFTLSVSEEVSCRLGSGGGLAYLEPPAFAAEESFGSRISLPSSAISSIPTQSELDKYADFASRYLQLVS